MMRRKNLDRHQMISVIKPNTEVDLAGAIFRFLTTLEAGNRTPATIRFYRSNLERFKWYAEQNNFPRLFRDIQKFHIELFLAYIRTNKERWGNADENTMSRKPVKPVTLHRYRATLNAFWNWAVRDKYADCNPVESIPVPSLDETIIEPLSATEIRKLVDVCRNDCKRDLAIVMVLLDSGIRLSELCGLTLRDWDYGRRLKVMGKGRKERYAALSPTSAKALMDYIDKERSASTFEEIFLSWQGTPLTDNGVEQLLKRRSKEAGIRHVNPHLLRHTFTQNWCLAGGPLHALQTLLGHSTPHMTLKYGRIFGTEAIELHSKYSPVERLGLRLREKKK